MNSIPIRRIKAEVKQPIQGSFSIRNLQQLLNGRDLVHDLHRHDFFFLLAIKKGNGIHEIDFTEYNVHEGSIFILRPGQVHRLELTADSDGFLLEFNATFYHPKDPLALQRLKKASNQNYCKIEMRSFEKLYNILENIFQEHLNKQDGYIDAIRSNLDLFFIVQNRQIESTLRAEKKENRYTQERFEEFTELLEKMVATEKQVSYYTSSMNLSSYQLNEITKAAVGKTASSLIDEYILLEAKRYLLATPNQIKEIADYLGYEDPSYFIRFFKKHTGLSPDAFRKNFK